MGTFFNSDSTLPIPSRAVWIGSSHPFDLQEVYLCFRSPSTWRLQDVPRQAELLITADSRYKLWINGQVVARGPARSYPAAQAVDRLEITPYLQAGANILAVQLYQPGYSHFSYLHRGAAGLLACLLCDGEVVLVSDSNWRVHRDDSFSSLVPRVSIYGSGVEERDLNLADDWTSQRYNDHDWSSARLVAAIGGSPWTGLRERMVPLLLERDIPMTLLETRRGPYPQEHQQDAHLALREGWREATAHALSAEAALPSDEEGWFHPQLSAGESLYWLFDLGRDYTCQGWIEIEGATGQELLSLSYQEKIRQGQLVISDPQTYCRVRLTDRFTLRPGAQVAEPFAMRGGRYLLIQLARPLADSPPVLEPAERRPLSEFRLRPHVRIAEYPLSITRPLSTSDGLLNQIIQLCETTFHACLQEGFVDCVWRESSQWLGDALPQSLIMASMSDDTRPLRQVIEMAAQGVYPDGVLPSILPGEVHAYTVVDYNFTWVELLCLYWKLTQDQAFVTQMWPTLVKMLERFQQDMNPEGLLISQPGRRLFLDWAPVSRNEPNAIYNLRYLLALQQAAQLADERAPFTTESSPWRTRATDLQRAIRRAFWYNGVWYDDLEQSTFSQHSAALALLTHTAEQHEEQTLLDAIAARSLNPNDQPAADRMVLASPFMHHYIFQALRQGGRDKQVIQIIRLRWGRWVKAGYPTTWENWNVDFPDGSQCHAFSAHPRYHLGEILGGVGHRFAHSIRQLGGLDNS